MEVKKLIRTFFISGSLATVLNKRLVVMVIAVYSICNYVVNYKKIRSRAPGNSHYPVLLYDGSRLR